MHCDANILWKTAHTIINKLIMYEIKAKCDK